MGLILIHSKFCVCLNVYAGGRAASLVSYARQMNCKQIIVFLKQLENRGRVYEHHLKYVTCSHPLVYYLKPAISNSYLPTIALSLNHYIIINTLHEHHYS